jgi:hypothetical protein
MADLEPLAGLSAEETQQLILLALLEMKERMPRIDTLDRQAVSIEAGSVGVSGTVSALTTLTAAQSVGQGATIRPLDAAPVHWANAGAEHIYRQIVVT